MVYRQVFAMDPMTSFHEGVGRLVVHRGQRADVADQLIQQRGLNEICLLRDQRLLRQDHLFGCDRVRWEKPPINIAPISKVRVIRILMKRQKQEDLNETFLSAETQTAGFITKAVP